MGLDDLLMSKAERTLMQSLSNSKHTILLLGNGFDLACGYATSYRDFYQSDYFINLVDRDESCLAQYIQYENMELNTREKRWADLEEMLWEYARLFFDLQDSDGKCLKQYFDLDDSMVQGFKMMCDSKDQMWWGLNYKSRMMLRLVDTALPDVDAIRFKEEYNLLRSSICQYLDGIVNEDTRISENDRTRRVYRLVNRWVESSEKCTALMFNYTSTLRDILIDLDLAAACDVKFLHGECMYGGEGIVVGIDDAMHVDDKCGFIEKSRNDACVRYAFAKNVELADRYVIFGSTVGATDGWYFQQLFRQEKPKVYEIYYYGVNDLEVICRRIEALSGMRIDAFERKHNLALINCELSEEDIEDEDVYLNLRKASYKKMVQRKVKSIEE